MPLLTETDVCSKLNTPSITKAEWEEMTQIRREMSFTMGRTIVRGKLVTCGKARRADFILYYKPNIPLALIEAKDNSYSVGNGMQQCLEYAVTLNIPFVFSSNGDGFLFHDRTGTSAEKETNLTLERFPSPDELWAKYYAWRGITSEAEPIVLQPFTTTAAAKTRATIKSTR